jgi:hypothetical protein
MISKLVALHPLSESAIQQISRNKESNVIGSHESEIY